MAEEFGSSTFSEGLATLAYAQARTHCADHSASPGTVTLGAVICSQPGGIDLSRTGSPRAGDRPSPTQMSVHVDHTGVLMTIDTREFSGKVTPSTPQRNASLLVPYPPWQSKAWAFVVWLEFKSQQDAKGASPEEQVAAATARRHIDEARRILETGKAGIGCWRHGVTLEAAYVNLHAAHSELVRVESNESLQGTGQEVLSQTRIYLDCNDTRRVTLERRLDGVTSLDSSDRPLLSVALAAAYAACDRAHERIRSVRTTLAISCFLLTLITALLWLVSAANSAALNLCFAVSGESAQVCPTGGAQPSGGDVGLVLVAGFLGAAVVGADALRDVRGSATPYNDFPLLLGWLKLALGALSALLGLLLIRGEFVPGLSGLSSSAQIVAWAAAFGGAQHLCSRLIDRQARGILDAARGSTDHPGRSSSHGTT